jgi:hypothetical protein
LRVKEIPQGQTQIESKVNVCARQADRKGERSRERKCEKVGNMETDRQNGLESQRNTARTDRDGDYFQKSATRQTDSHRLIEEEKESAKMSEI